MSRYDYLPLVLFTIAMVIRYKLWILSPCSVWIGNKAAKMYSLHSSKWYLAAFALRQRMLNFVQNFEYYMMFEVVEQNWLMFQTNMENVSLLYCRFLIKLEEFISV